MPDRGEATGPASGAVGMAQRASGSGDRPDAFNDPEVAWKILGTLCQSRDWERIKARSFFDVSRRSNCTLYRLIHEHILLSEVANSSVRRVLSLKAQLDTEKKASTELLQALEEKFKEKEAEHAMNAAVLEREASTALEGLKKAEAFIQEQAELAEKKAAEHEARIKKMKKKVKALERAVEDMARQRDDAVRARDDAIRRREDDVTLAGMRAVEKFRTSPAFGQEMTEAGLISYEEGIEITIKRVLRRYPDLDLDGLESDDEADGGGESDPTTKTAGEQSADDVAPEAAVGPPAPQTVQR